MIYLLSVIAIILLFSLHYYKWKRFKKRKYLSLRHIASKIIGVDNPKLLLTEEHRSVLSEVLGIVFKQGVVYTLESLSNPKKGLYDCPYSSSVYVCTFKGMDIIKCEYMFLQNEFMYVHFGKNQILVPIQV